MAQKKGTVRHSVVTAQMAEMEATRLRWRSPLRIEASPAKMMAMAIIGASSMMSQRRDGSPSKKSSANKGDSVMVSTTLSMAAQQLHVRTTFTNWLMAASSPDSNSSDIRCTEAIGRPMFELLCTSSAMLA